MREFLTAGAARSRWSRSIRCTSGLRAVLPRAAARYVAPEEIFTEYAYFSSYSDTGSITRAQYTDAIIERFGLGPTSLVVELASNDGYLLQHFVARGIPVLGIEPAANVAAAGEERGRPDLVEFFGAELAGRLVADGATPT